MDNVVLILFFFDIAQPDPISLDFENSTILGISCFGDCNGMTDLFAIGGTSSSGQYTYTWEDNFVGGQRNDLCEGLYYVTISDDENCEFIDSITIPSIALLEFSIDSSATVNLSCGNDSNGTIITSTNGGCGSYEYTWENNESETGVAQNLGPGTYNVTVTDGCGCTEETTYTLESATALNAVAIDPEKPVCVGNQSCVGIESVSGGTGLNYTFSVGFGERLPIDSCLSVSPGMYTLLVLIVQDVH